MTKMVRVRPLLIASMTLAAALVTTGQDFMVQPPPMMISTSTAAPLTQSFDQPVPGGRSPRNASYDIDVRLDPASHTVKGLETLHWRNISRQDAVELQFHLYWNARRNADSTYMREAALLGTRLPVRDDEWGSIDVTAIRVRSPQGATPPRDVTSQLTFLAPDDENAADRTVFAVPLPQPLRPQETIDVDVEWSARVPRPFYRTGYVGNYYFFGQWFPKVGVLEDAGWNTHQFHKATEFYADFGAYDVRMTVPRGWTIGASGRQTARTENADGTATHRYHGDDIHDFAWTTSPDFVEQRQTFTHPSLPAVEMRLLLRPEHAGQEARHFNATAAALKYYGEWFGAYPFENITIIDPAFQSDSDGMEYPTLFTAGTSWIAPSRSRDPEDVTIHEAGHQWWYAMVATNEFEDAWMDEGINQFSGQRAFEAAGFPNDFTQHFFGGFVPWTFRDVGVSRADDDGWRAQYQAAPTGDAQATPTFRYWPGSATVTTYAKTNIWLSTLERQLGWPTVQRILRTYFERWKFKHPKPADFFRVASEVSGRDLTPFFDEVYRGSNAFDYGVQYFASEKSKDRYRTVVVAQRLGEAIFPVDVVTTFGNGERATETWTGRERRRTFVYDRPSQATTVQVDPARILMLDANSTNNSRTLEPRARAASLKWALTWMVWLQDLMVTYGFFA